MLKFIMMVSLAVGIAGATSAAETTATETYDLLFKSGTLQDIGLDQRLVYDRTVANSLKPETAERDTGKITLSFEDGQVPQAKLKFTQGEKYRNLGVFPASVGNPIIMYFVETVVRDMAESAGGSPFYIRNRVKEALVEPAEISKGKAIIAGKTIETVDVTIHPFKGDPNIERMKGFGQLALTVSMSDEVPGWYLVLGALAAGADGGEPVYSSIMTFDQMGSAE